jgi:hypothetical protein
MGDCTATMTAVTDINLLPSFYSIGHVICQISQAYVSNLPQKSYFHLLRNIPYNYTLFQTETLKGPYTDGTRMSNKPSKYGGKAWNSFTWPRIGIGVTVNEAQPLPDSRTNCVPWNLTHVGISLNAYAVLATKRAESDSAKRN